MQLYFIKFLYIINFLDIVNYKVKADATADVSALAHSETMFSNQASGTPSRDTTTSEAAF